MESKMILFTLATFFSYQVNCWGLVGIVFFPSTMIQRSFSPINIHNIHFQVVKLESPSSRLESMRTNKFSILGPPLNRLQLKQINQSNNLYRFKSPLIGIKKLSPFIRFFWASHPPTSRMSQGLVGIVAFLSILLQRSISSISVHRDWQELVPFLQLFLRDPSLPLLFTTCTSKG